MVIRKIVMRNAEPIAKGTLAGGTIIVIPSYGLFHNLGGAGISNSAAQRKDIDAVTVALCNPRQAIVTTDERIEPVIPGD